MYPVSTNSEIRWSVLFRRIAAKCCVLSSDPKHPEFLPQSTLSPLAAASDRDRVEEFLLGRAQQIRTAPFEFSLLSLLSRPDPPASCFLSRAANKSPNRDCRNLSSRRRTGDGKR